MDPMWGQIGSVLLQLTMGLSLAACTGLRAFLPLLVVGVAGRLDLIPLVGSFEWLASWPALIVFGIAVVSEILADKVPVVDNFLDVLQLWVKPIAGVMVAASVMTELSPLMGAVVGLVIGGSAAGAVHVAKAKLRLLSTAGSAGLANPVVSTAEDAGALLGSLGAILVPVVVLILIVVALIVAWIAARQLRPARQSAA